MASTVEALRVVNADGGSAVFTVGTADASAGGIAVQSLLWSPYVGTTQQPRGDRSGLFPAFAYVRGMTIQATGLIIGPDATDYWARRAVLAAAVLPAAGTLDPQADKNHGTVYATFAGTEVYAGVTVAQWQAPIDLTGESVTPYTVNWLNPDGYWKLVSDDSEIRL